MGLAYVDDVGNNQFGFGTQVKIGIDYMLNDHVGVGLELNSLNSFFKKPEKIKIRDNERYGFSRLGLMAGVRYYFWKQVTLSLTSPAFVAITGFKAGGIVLPLSLNGPTLGPNRSHVGTKTFPRYD